MGNGFGKLSVCFTGAHQKHDMDVKISDMFDEGLGHSFCYVRPESYRFSSSKVHSEETTMFRSISGASVSANTSTPLSTAFVDLYSYNGLDRASSFESSTSFASIPLQPVPRCFANSGPFSGNLGGIMGSGPIERGFLSGPIERGFMSGPIDRGFYSGPVEKGFDQFQRSFSHGSFTFKTKSKKGNLIRLLQRAIAKKVSRGQNSVVAPIKGVVSVKESDWVVGLEKNSENGKVSSSTNLKLDDEDDSFESQNLQWAQGKAGEDRVHVVVSEEHGWVFVGIYDGFNGPDATDYLLSNLYPAVHKELKGLLWEDKNNSTATITTVENSNTDKEISCESNHSRTRNGAVESCSRCVEPENYPSQGGDFNSNSNSNSNSRNRSKNPQNRCRGAAKKWEENQRRKCEWNRERLELDERINSSSGTAAINHSNVLKALSQALKKTEESYFDISDTMATENPELALMGSCVMVMLMKGEDVYSMNVGDSRAIIAQKAVPELRLGKTYQDLERINEETLHDLDILPNLAALQLTMDHSTCVEEEVQRIKNEHPDDASAVVNNRVKGSLKVTRAFGAGFLKQPKWNNALLEMFRIDYVGTSPYINCFPYLYHHRLGPKDRFLILSSDGLYQYFTNEEAVSEVELFIDLSPEGDPAQHLVEEVLFRAAKKAGMDFHDLLEIPQGDRRRYHDDIFVIIISLEGRIWRSCM